MIYRDDDINYLTSADELKRIHEPFACRGVVHTVAVEMYQLWENKSLFHFLATDRFIDIELHGWRHDDYSTWTSKSVRHDLSKAIDYWNEHVRDHDFLNTITTFFPPWNKTSQSVVWACRELGLKLSHERSDYAWQFHYWEVTAEDVEAVLSGAVSAKDMQRLVKSR